MNTQEQAMQYLEKGLSIIPIKPRGKVPSIKWCKFQKRKAISDEVKHWFKTWPNANIGIVTGSVSGIAVVDFDTEKAFKDAKRKWLPDAPMVKTGKGYHLYCKYSEGVRNFQKRDDLPGIDLRAEGGCVVAPPSIHESGHTYRWLKGHELGSVELPELPSWLLARNESEKTPLAELYQDVEKGGRDNSLARLVGSWANDGLSHKECLKIAHAVNSSYKPPLPPDEVKRCVTSIFNTHHKNKKARIVEAVETRDGLGSMIKSTEFDLTVFPEKLQKLILKIAEAFNINYEPVATIMLSFLSAAIGNTVRISPKQSWEEPIFIWSMVTGPSGSGKTPFASMLLDPIKDLQTRASNTNHPQRLTADERGVQLQSNFIASDTTVESLANILESSPRGILMFYDELAGYIKMHDRYTKGNDRQKYIEAWNCQPWYISRVSSGNRNIRDVGLSICGGIQLKIVPQVFNSISIDDGLLPRFLFTNVQEKSYSETHINSADLQIWHDLILKCYRIQLEVNEDGHNDHKILKLSEEAHRLFADFNNRYRKMGYYSNDESLRIFSKKLINYCLRLAGVLHVIKFGVDKTAMEANIIEDAIKITDYYLGQACIVIRTYGKKKKCKISETQKFLIKAIYALSSEVKSGRLRLSKIVKEYNQYVPDSIKLDEQKMAYELRYLGLDTRLSGGFSHLIWEPEKIQELFNLI